MINKKKFFLFTMILIIILLPIRIFIEHKDNKQILFQYEELETSLNIKEESYDLINFLTKKKSFIFLMVDH